VGAHAFCVVPARCACEGNTTTTLEESARLAETRYSLRNNQHDRNNTQQRKSTHKFNEVRRRAYVLGAREREILLIQKSITNYSFFKKFPMEIFSRILGDTMHEGSSSYL